MSGIAAGRTLSGRRSSEEVFVPDEVPEPEVDWSDEDPPAEAAGTADTAHDDIMKRLLDYQRSLREGASPEEAAEIMREGTTDSAVLEASSTAESLAELLSTEVVPDEAVAVESEPVIEPAVEVPFELEVEPELEREPSPVRSLEPEAEEAVGAEPPVETIAEPALASGDLEAIGGSRSELEARVGKLEGQLEGLGARIAELRRSFQDMAIAADERLATMADEVEQARRERERD